MNWKRVIPAAVAVIAAAAVIAARPTRHPAPAQPGAPPSAAAAVTVVAAGRVEPLSEEIEIGAEIEGRLRRVYVEEGQTVRAGQILAEIENADFTARLQHARAVVAERQAALDRAHAGARPMQRREAQAAIREAEAVLDNAAQERGRRATLLDRGAISRTEFDSAEREFRVARARLDAALDRQELIEDEVRPEDRDRAAAELARARAQEAEAEALLAKTLIRAPLAGVVLRKHRHAGESVSPEGRQPLVTLGDVTRLRVRAEIDETDVARVHAGQPAYVTAAAYGDRRFTGHVVRVGQLLGRKSVTTDSPSERVDTKVLETLIELDAGQALPVGLRVDAFVSPE
ncbi:MAG: efflux RND transporter periplasmic adaptor subunit [Bryobacterales bacterium]|nr:efflux RND transporter periplasmic adaptor subunit [Bryobacterales bacterium]